MGFFRQFDEFDPLTGTIPDDPFSSLSSLASRARRLLNNRTRDEIVSAARSADFFIEEHFIIEKDNYIQRLLDTGGWELGYLPYESRNERGIRELLDNWPTDMTDSPPGLPTPENTSEIDALKECIGRYSLDDDPEFTKGREFEYFAVLALWLIVDATHWLKWTEAPTSVQYSNAGLDALSAMDAVCYAEHLHATEAKAEELANLRLQFHQVAQKTDALAEEKAKQRVSLAATKAAIKRHTENYAMKEQIFAWCAAHLDEYSSMDAAAEAVTGKLVPVKFRTLRSWIGEYRKNEQSARKP